MPHFSSLLQGLARSLSVGRDRKADGAGDGKAAAALRSSGTLGRGGSETFAAACSRRGEKGINQDCSIVLEGFGCQEDTVFCGIFDGHGPWGHYVAKAVRESLPPSLAGHWQEAITLASLIDGGEKRLGDLIVVANVGDSRAVLATKADDDDGAVVAEQLTVDFKPNLPQEGQRIRECNGRVHCLSDEPGVHRVWLPDRESPGLAMSRAFGDYCVKDYGVISAPEVTQRRISSRDQFIILATDGVWDVISNEEAVQIVAATADREKAAKRLVESAVRAWRRKRRGIAVDDCSAICLFFHSTPS
ncbi:hypothetical protein PR202_gb00938 [Eleusine coracana subsp. coracana]|uniref:protein-serine/threonine phosphatase n=1 Tax=Eleusine coracana subsp. coracana TaxID=191504 RepID=A0AAV5DV26_ELECO|nr:hypothetical protein PR202_gb00938 [Eleusine coracana subsp. coracana]